MSVFIIFECVPDEESNVISVWINEQKAKDEVERLNLGLDYADKLCGIKFVYSKEEVKE